ncbi:hypothetical protein XO10_09105 [Marinitoga sp. 1135]|uniref:DUF2225 domain-containing protein n=1 Tax=Marinitoga piezophila (strain DSM 14283 / JCM 11233 / KA3) TaxID=443254 RepID=H2J676_MARPK|nr:MULTISPECIES: DUF2225 domain-containing protein [Marinitoga]AEX86224.1 hypothetical protein Marpi_1843 [Marinitoga piezophila KA3]APT76636.1 hypothetical protein LN42_09785 [Marinitoga sp. 1137]NUU96411.1 hypothetical protein [Marinitoga sp. 1135]NUU98332.1 hypothetical protein [Marinitoga sp. 1138]
MGDFWEDTTSCPLCGKAFPYTKIKIDSIRIEKYDDDLKPTYRGPNPLHFSILTCPKCGFTYFNGDDDLFKRIGKDTKKDLKEYLKRVRDKMGKIDNSKNKSIDFLKKQYALAGIVYKIVNNPGRIARTFIRLAWIFREEGKEMAELKMLVSAVEILEKNFKDLNSDEDLIMYYFFKGYTNYRIGKKKEAKEFFNKLVGRYKNSKNPYVKQAEKLKGDL